MILILEFISSLFNSTAIVSERGGSRDELDEKTRMKPARRRRVGTSRTRLVVLLCN